MELGWWCFFLEAPLLAKMKGRENGVHFAHNNPDLGCEACNGGGAGFTTGGALHFVLNNQLGFTTTPAEGRSSPHPTSVGSGAGFPVLHVNADEPELVVRAARLAAEFRSEFQRDCVVDIVGYRRYVRISTN
jgi:Dehydrogenase E1 component